jgi:hypothetical protein
MLRVAAVAAITTHHQSRQQQSTGGSAGKLGGAMHSVRYHVLAMYDVRMVVFLLLVLMYVSECAS